MITPIQRLPKSEGVGPLSLPFIQEKFQVALEKFYKSDSDLIEIDANERSMTHHLALYLEPVFPGWNIDCEYNRRGEDPKRLHSQSESVSSDNLDGNTVFPDIIVHHRGRDSNLLVVEAKRRSADGNMDPKDQNKLKGYLEELGYCFGVWLAINTSLAEATLVWFINDNGRCKLYENGAQP